MTAQVRTFLLEGNPRLQRIFGVSSAAFVAIACAPGTLMLILAAAAGVASVPARFPGGYAEDLGIWWQANWSFTYIVVVPALLVSARRLSARIERSMDDLTETEVIVPADETDGTSITADVRARFRANARALTWTCLAVSVAFLVVDTWPLVSWTRAQMLAMRVGETCAPAAVEMDWSTAFADASCWGTTQLDPDFVHPSPLANVSFNVYAYALQTFWVFLALLMISRIALFFYYLADYFAREQGKFRIEPLWDDPLRRLGLTALGQIYNLMLSMLLLFELYVVAHRLQQIADHQQISVIAYLRELTRAVDEPSRWLDPELLHLATIDAGTWFAILIVAPLVFMICWFPLFRIRNYIEERRIELTKEYARARKAAHEQGDEAATEAFDRKARALHEANVWPNGDRAAWRFLYAMIALWVGSIVPMAFIVLATLFAVPELLGLIAELVTRIMKKRSSPTVFAD